MGYFSQTHKICFLQRSYCGSPRLVATPGEGSILSSGDYSKITMDGKEVYKFATREVPRVLMEAMDAAEGIDSVEDIDWLLLHQVGARCD
jgi:3-oxoacyl-[acyl-carrier-protein] synthase III